ncbi:MAG: VCBS repeat-containing protein [SAR324 cluster bacterium]|nr:VCBS repeat-containing protein [SAR324 cluster bacterium]
MHGIGCAVKHALWVAGIIAMGPIVTCLAARTVPARPVLEVSELRLSFLPERVAIVPWQGRPAVMVLSQPAGGADEARMPVRRLILLRLREGALKEFASWETPAELRWSEPVPLPGGGSGWLGLIGGEWFLARGGAGGLNWERLCGCPTVFSLGRAPLRRSSPFAADLDGDGWPEVLLPHWNGLTVYALDADAGTLRPLWRDAWEPKERFEQRGGKLEVRLTFPRYLLRDVNRDGVRDLIQLRQGALSTTIHPPRAAPPAGEYYALDWQARARLKRRGLPDGVLLALLDLGDRGYRSAAELARDLAEPGSDASEYLEAVLEAARTSIPVFFPEPATLPAGTGLAGQGGTEAADASRDVLAVEDMDGDGLPDLLELTSTEKGDPFNQENEIRWFPGSLEGDAFGFGDPPNTYFTEGPAFAQLIHPQREGGAPTLFLATMDVDLMSLIRAIVTRTVTFDAYLYPWREGALPKEPPIAGEFSFDVDFSEKGARPMMLMADLDGDGQREFLFNLEEDALSAFPSEPGEDDLDEVRLARVEVPLPRKAEDVLVADLDGSGREMLLLRYRGKRFSNEERRTLRVVRLEQRPE